MATIQMLTHISTEFNEYVDRHKRPVIVLLLAFAVIATAIASADLSLADAIYAAGRF